ncbi:hypothetical protein M8C21_005065 [Ambrosia artemisiifolia]|uniref:Uncharacterized protein n=1 Tax=Ambrosia artemisiifolia TaxID=4212 RepID=A0AAD5CV41_AMBAR|nr:hypothetical protein M8C21_005065 [Ambrosia artemisiifolia]
MITKKLSITMVPFPFASNSSTYPEKMSAYEFTLSFPWAYLPTRLIPLDLGP